MAPLHMPIEKTDVHTGGLRVIFQVAGAIIQRHLIERSPGNQAEIAVRVLLTALVLAGLAASP